MFAWVLVAMGGCWFTDEEFAHAAAAVGGDDSGGRPQKDDEHDTGVALDDDTASDTASGSASDSAWDTGTDTAPDTAEGCDDPPGVGPAALTLTELMADPASVAQYYGEWFEVRNNTTAPMDLLGLEVESSSGGFTVDSSFVLAGGSYAVFGVSDDISVNGGVPVDYVYLFSAMNLDSPDDALALRLYGEDLDRLDWDSSWGFESDLAWQASTTVEGLEWANDLPHNWCSSPKSFGTSGLAGTPGTGNEDCDDAGLDIDGDGFSPADGDCDDRDSDVHPCAVDDARIDDDADCDGVRDDD